MKQTVKDCHGKIVVEKAFAYLDWNFSTTEILHNAEVKEFCIPFCLTVGYNIITNTEIRYGQRRYGQQLHTPIKS